MNIVILHSLPLSMCLHMWVIITVSCHVLSLQTLCYVVSICSHRFFQSNQSPESKIGYQKQLIGTVSGSPALKLSWDDLFGSEFYKVCFVGLY